MEGVLIRNEDELGRVFENLRKKSVMLETTRNTYESAKGTPNEDKVGKELADSKLVVAEAKRDVAEAKLDVTKAKRDIASNKCDLAEGTADKQEANEQLGKAERDVLKVERDVAEAKRDVLKAERDVLKAERDVAEAKRDVAAEVLSIAEATGVAASPLGRTKRKYDDCEVSLGACEMALATAQKAVDRMEQDLSANSPQKESDSDSPRRQRDLVLATYDFPGLGNAVMKHVDGDGVIKTGVLDLTMFKFPEEFGMPKSPLFISDHMRNIWRLVNVIGWEKGVAIAGSPGVGKSVFMFLYAMRVASAGHTVYYLRFVLERENILPRTYVICGERIDQVSRVKVPPGVGAKFFVDGLRSGLAYPDSFNKWCCMTTSGEFDRDLVHNVNAPECLFFPAWKLSDVKELINATQFYAGKGIFADLSGARLEEKYRLCGGSLRLLLGLNYREAQDATRAILAKINDTNVLTYLGEEAALGKHADSIVRTYVPLKEFGEYDYRERSRKLDSEYLRNHIVEKISVDRWKQLSNLPGSIGGVAFENLFVTRAKNKEVIKLMACKYDFKGSMEGFSALEWKLTGLKWFQGKEKLGDHLQEKGMLYVPQDKKFPVIDCFVRNGDKETDYIQLTISGNHSFSKETLSDIRNKVGGMGSSGRYFAIVRDSDVARRFRLRGKKSKKNVVDGPSNMELWVAYLVNN